MKKLLAGFILLSFGLLAGYYGQPFIQQQLQQAGWVDTEQKKELAQEDATEKILYWVAPMDANYRRDKAGKSPMGMDLVPVYAKADTEAGVVSISPVVQNNLGVRLEQVKKGMLDREIHTVAYVGFDEEKLSHIHVRVEGWIETLAVRAEGEQVKKGQKLFELYSPTLVNAQEEYLTALRSKNAILINASQNRLIALGISPGQISKLKKSRSLRKNISYYAKQAGFIEKLHVRDGMFIKPATDVMTLAQINSVWVIAEVFERQSAWVKQGQTVDMYVDAYPDKTWKGIVDYIYPTLDAKTRTLRVRIRFNNPEQLLKPNMFSHLTLHSSSGSKALLVKREAIIRTGTMERVVKALGDGKFLSVPVQTGYESGAYIEILEGLEENDQIVTSAQFLLDSESSLTASFARMETPENTLENMTEAAKEANPVWIEGLVVDVMQAHNMLTIEHKPVAAWGWPGMVMDFPVHGSVDLQHIKAQEKVRFLVKKQESGAIELLEIQPLEMHHSQHNDKEHKQ